MAVSPRGEAFRKARAEGKLTFTFQGKSFNTRMAGESEKEWRNKMKKKRQEPSISAQPKEKAKTKPRKIQVLSKEFFDKFPPGAIKEVSTAKGKIKLYGKWMTPKQALKIIKLSKAVDKPVRFAKVPGGVKAIRATGEKRFFPRDRAAEVASSFRRSRRRA